jgi:homoserine kinase
VKKGVCCIVLSLEEQNLPKRFKTMTYKRFSQLPREEALRELSDFPAHIESFKVIKITLSGGGPADWIEVKTDNTGYILGMEYHYADWYDHAERKISENSYLWDFAAQIAETER